MAFYRWGYHYRGGDFLRRWPGNNSVEAFNRLKGAGTIKVLALVIDFLGLFRQIAAGTSMRSVSAYRATHHVDGSPVGFNFARLSRMRCPNNPRFSGLLYRILSTLSGCGLWKVNSASTVSFSRSNE